MSFRTITRIMPFTLFLALCGCAFAPGMTMSTLAPDLEIKPITVELIQAIEAQRAQEVGKIPNEVPPKAPQYQYRIGPRDILSITVWDHPELTIPAGEFRTAEAAGHIVAEDGTIFFPYAGKVNVAGKSIVEVREALTRAIAGKIANPQLDVRVAAYRSQRAYVVGEVKKPGVLPITDVPMSVVEAINLAGDTTPEAALSRITLTRKGQVVPIDLQAIYEKGDFSQNHLLQDGDILQVADRNLQKVFVLGEVERPSALLMHKGRMTLAEAIGEAGGVDRTSSNPGRIYVLRGNPKQPEVFHLDGNSADALILGDQFNLRPRDIVYVDTAGVVRWNRVIEQLLPTVDLLNAASDTEFPLFRGKGTTD